jgi:hypothetical protein
MYYLRSSVSPAVSPAVAAVVPVSPARDPEDDVATVLVARRRAGCTPSPWDIAVISDLDEDLPAARSTAASPAARFILRSPASILPAPNTA